MQDSKVNVHKDLFQEVSEHYNEVVIDYTGKCARLVGCGQDEFDWYYIVHYMYGGGKSPMWLSAVGGLVYLKNKIDDNDYNNLDRTLSLNNAPRTQDPLKWVITPYHP